MTKGLKAMKSNRPKLIAGGNWNNAANAGYRCRNANNYRWNTNSNIGGRFAADTGNRANSWLDLPALSKRAKYITEGPDG